jgi:hypothetical protein
VKILLSLTVLFSVSFSAYALPDIECRVTSSSHQGVAGVEFNRPIGSSRMTQMLVRFADGGTEEYKAEGDSEIRRLTWASNIIFLDIAKAGVATLNYFFFYRPEDDICRRPIPECFRPITGAKMKLVLPPATEILSLSCVKNFDF